MSELPEIIELGPQEEAERLWKGAMEARESAADDLVALCESLDLGIRTAEILVIQKLHPVKDDFPATIAIQLEIPSPEVDTFRDAVNVPNTLGFTDILDLLSVPELECVSPGLHRGWEDRRFSCRRSRERAQEATGIALEAVHRDRLLLLSAYRNRIFRYPPPIRVAPKEILDALDSLQILVESLVE